MADSYADVQQSFGRCLQRPDFLRRFYTLFMASHPKISEKFEQTDFDQQIHLLRHGISASLTFASGGSLGRSILDRIGETHSARGPVAVEPWMYDFWLDALMQAVAESDPQLDEKLERRWREAMGTALQYIRSAA